MRYQENDPNAPRWQQQPQTGRFGQQGQQYQQGQQGQYYQQGESQYGQQPQGQVPTGQQYEQPQQSGYGQPQGQIPTGQQYEQPQQGGYGQPQGQIPTGQQYQQGAQGQYQQGAQGQLPTQYQQPPGQQSLASGSMQMQMPSTQPQQMVGQRPQPRLRQVSVEDVVQTDVVTADPDTPIRTVVASMAKENVGSVVLVENDRPRGVLTDRKIALAIESMPDIGDKTAADLVDHEVVTASSDESIFDALDRMSEANIRRLPIVDDAGHLEGIVALDDVLLMLSEKFADAADIIRSQSQA
ncbi:CBS domain-containing protein [Haloarchaeobius sp. HRN-SO-5]|uniref:CBS domain-containing protein n=1 Tax=Haloarchaeobius sp. HRN-SO-5 TaxID=3446118 RepID=UPI003EBDE0FD